MRTVAAMSGAVDLSGLKARADSRPASATGGGGAGPGGAAITVTDQSFATEVIDESKSKLVVVALVAAYSEQSRTMVGVLESLAAADGGSWRLAVVDIEAAPSVARAFGAESVPTVIAVAGGRAVTAFAGAQPAQAVRQWLDDVLAQLGPDFADAAAEDDVEEQTDPRRDAAEQLAADGDYEGARAAYEAIVHADPTDTEAAAAAKQMGFFGRALGHEPGAVDRAAAAPDDVDLALAAADEELVAGDAPAAFSRLVAAVRRTAGDERTAVRTRLLELFELFDSADPAVLSARRDLAAALF